MGVNIHLYKIEGVEVIEDDYPVQSYKQFKKHEPEWWDWLRRSGDKDFCANIDFKYRHEGDDPQEDRFYQRPEDIDKAIEWVKANVAECNQPRMLRALEEMQKDESLWFYMSW